MTHKMKTEIGHPYPRMNSTSGKATDIVTRSINQLFVVYPYITNYAATAIKSDTAEW